MDAPFAQPLVKLVEDPGKGGRGEAAEVFRARWEEWNSGALAVIDQLSVAADGLDHVRRSLTSTDGDAAQTTGRLTGRLG